jgi:hypothetical protein
MSINIGINNILVETELPNVCINGINKQTDDLLVCVDNVLRSCKENDNVIIYVSDKGTVPNPSVITEEQIMLPSISDITGFTFKGWTTISGSSTVEYNAGVSYTFSESITLYAVWQISTYDLYLYKYNSLYAAKSANYNTYIQPGACAANANETFVGWTNVYGNTDIVYTNTSYILMNIRRTLYAVFEISQSATYFCSGDTFSTRYFTVSGGVSVSFMGTVVKGLTTFSNLTLVSRDPQTINEVCITVGGNKYLTSWSSLTSYSYTNTALTIKVKYTGDYQNFGFIQLSHTTGSYRRSSL